MSCKWLQRQGWVPFVEDDPQDFCDGAMQNQEKPISLCAEHPLLGGVTVSHPAKGGLGTLSGVTTPVQWKLPSPEDFKTFSAHYSMRFLPKFDAGASDTPGFTKWWTSRVGQQPKRGGRRLLGWYFGQWAGGAFPGFGLEPRATEIAVRCIATP